MSIRLAGLFVVAGVLLVVRVLSALFGVRLLHARVSGDCWENNARSAAAVQSPSGAASYADRRDDAAVGRQRRGHLFRVGLPSVHSDFPVCPVRRTHRFGWLLSR